MARGLAITAVIAAVVLGAGAGLWLAGGEQGAVPVPTSAAKVLPQPQPISDFRLVSDDGEPLTRRALQGRWTLAFFGYTHCPDICPVTLNKLARMKRALAEAGVDPAQVLFVSVDPRRDGPARLAEYVGYFDDAFVGATGEPQALKALTGELGIGYSVPDAPADADYEVDHSASVVLIGPKARVQAYFTAPHEPAVMAADFRKILAHRGE